MFCRQERRVAFFAFRPQESWVTPFVFRHGHEPKYTGPAARRSKRSPRRTLLLSRKLSSYGKANQLRSALTLGLSSVGLARGLRVGVGGNTGGRGVFTVVSLVAVAVEGREASVARS